MKFFIFFFLTTLILQAQQPYVHTPWDLEDAQARIDFHRKGDAEIQFLLHDEVIGSEADINFELVSHEFNFGVSMTQAGRFATTPYFDKYTHYVKELFNFVNIGIPVRLI